MKAKTLSQKLAHYVEGKMNEEIVLEKLRKFEADAIWFDEHYEELKRQYKDEWVAVFQKQVIDHHENLKTLMKRLRKNHPQQVGDMVVEFVTTEEAILIL